MAYILTFMEGIITFLSPCVLPLLPVYLFYFAGGEEKGIRKTFVNTLSFSAGFTLVFTILGVFAGTAGAFLARHATAVNLFTGGMVLLFGLHYMGILKIGILERSLKMSPEMKASSAGAGPSFLLGIIFAVGWSPCVGVFLGSAMMMAAGSTHWFRGMMLLVSYSAGLSLPLILSGIFVDSLSGLFKKVKSNYNLFNKICGGFLAVLGILMMTGTISRISAALV